VKNKIVVVGSINMDLVVNTPRVPVIGETILGSGFATVPGGKGANQAVAISRLGGDVAMIGCVGQDIFGRDLLENLKTNGVNTANVKMLDNTPTGIAVIVVKDGNNFIIVDPGSNYKLTPEMTAALENEIKDCYMIVVQLEIPMETAKKAIEIAKSNNVKVLLNPAPAVPLDDELLRKVDILTPNESECAIITGLPVENAEDAKKAVKYLNNKGVKQALITLGGNGVVYNSGNTVIHKTVPKVKAVDTTAAGDSFSGALAVALSEGMDIDAAVDFASKVGTLTVMKKGAQTSLPYRKDVENYNL